jgi:hypothetical protein
MRFVVARRSGRRGEGLGNEMLPWAKGWIASQVLDARLIGPSWGLNRRGYFRNFRTSRLDFLYEDLFAHLPHHAFTQQRYLDTGEIDFGKAIQKWATKEGITQNKAFIVTVDGMYGGYPSIRSARPFLWAKLLDSRDALQNQYEIASTLDRDKLFVTVHMRLGSGFETLPEGESSRGKVNLKIPVEWYLSVCKSIRDEFGDRVQFHFFTDQYSPAFDRAVSAFNPGQPRQTGLTECSDLLLMSQADLRVCSLSSYSLISCFLSGGPYLWYEPQLTYLDGNYSLWGMEDAQQSAGSPTRQSLTLMKSIRPGSLWESGFRGYAMDTGSALPHGLVEQLQRRLIANNRSASLLEYGCLPDWTLRHESSVVI